MIRIPALSRRGIIRSARQVSRVYALPAFRSFHFTNVLKLTEPIRAIDNSDNTPWYLREEQNISTKPADRPPIPYVPESAPSTVTEFLRLLAEEYGLQEIQLFDLNTLDASHPQSVENQPFDYIIICTGKSERHIYKAGQELKHYIKHNFQKQVKVNGLVSAAPNAVARRRMLKRANKAPLATDNDYGKTANSWVMCETSVDNICIHVLTKDRRAELDLESLWVEEKAPEPVEKQEESVAIKNVSDIPEFFLTRRKLHTSTRYINHELATCLTNLMEEEVDSLNSQKLNQYITEFEASFVNPNVEDHKFRSIFYSILHFIDHSVVSLEKVTEVMLDKYADLAIAIDESVNMKHERSSDVTTYMKVLIDSPQLQASLEPKPRSDKAFDMLAQFSMNVYRFSGETIDPEANPEFIPLLWKLAFTSTNNGELDLGPSVIDETLYDNKDYYHQKFSTSVQAENRTRDMMEVLNFYLGLKSDSRSFSRSFKELQLFSLGNSGRWDEFWNHWDVSMSLLDDKKDIQRWARLIVYLALRNDVRANKIFVQEYWSGTHKMSGSFMEQFQARSGDLKESETHHLKVSLGLILESQHKILPDSALDEIRTFASTL
ncbi:hypothetical protein CANTEDRAFT_124819 [Yamadazyma tenuis ATCC 10573]|uniref:ATPase synthesis protein 25 n=1 Tax=Candida tenuis (strain ATCC 10573 / BCRC 21748 / CBS 615 / JCM 9827 / NBRC 10315 / NRRL Y-1498 / VKM Y-70) TaxID=590646 RepID=G3B8J3_CANTC|nr:uncharacterized protein CANTEDRAFT_124819 [Yamadazyma tenuis ATCC 10573]EGV61747.1 hypothetical protein CANTEDRAFT_124819 [Yamadazyma tenuis ATCC 10573]